MLKKGIFSGWLVIMVYAAFSLNAPGDSLRYDVLMNSSFISQSNKTGAFIDALELTPSKMIVLSTSDQFYMLGDGKFQPVMKKSYGRISSFAYTSDGLLMVIQNDEVCVFDSAGNLRPLCILPERGMGISAGKNVMYIYGRDKTKERNSLFALAQGGEYKKLIDVPGPINYVTEMNGAILIASGHLLFSVDPQTYSITKIAALPKEEKIISIAVEDSSQSIFFSTEKTLLAKKGDSTILITGEIGGVLKIKENSLFILNPATEVLIRIYDAGQLTQPKRVEEEKVVVQPKDPDPIIPIENDTPKKDVVTNEKVVQMVQAGLSDDLIIELINSSVVDFDLSVDATIALANQKVSSPVITVMRNVAKAQEEKK